MRPKTSKTREPRLTAVEVEVLEAIANGRTVERRQWLTHGLQKFARIDLFIGGKVHPPVYLQALTRLVSIGYVFSAPHDTFSMTALGDLALKNAQKTGQQTSGTT